MRKFKYDWKLVDAYLDTHGVRETIEHFGMSNRTWNKALVRGDVSYKPKHTDLTTVFVQGAVSRNTIKRAMLAAGVQQCCAIEGCGLTHWLGRPISLHLDHMNGDKHDNRFENLRLLCPNCHSQTDTYGGRNVKRKRKLGNARQANQVKAPV